MCAIDVSDHDIVQQSARLHVAVVLKDNGCRVLVQDRICETRAAEAILPS
jgi:hypothetical protein